MAQITEHQRTQSPYIAIPIDIVKGQSLFTFEDFAPNLAGYPEKQQTVQAQRT